MAKNHQSFIPTPSVPTAPVEYDFVLDGGRTNHLLRLINNGDAPVTLKTISFTTNAAISAPEESLGIGNQWGSVEITQTGNLYTYSLTLSTPFTLQPGSNDVLEYSVGCEEIELVPEGAQIPKTFSRKKALLKKINDQYLVFFYKNNIKCTKLLSAAEVTEYGLNKLLFPKAADNPKVIPTRELPHLMTRLLKETSTAVLGPLNVSMPPQSVSIQLQDQAALQEIELTNPNPQSDPHPGFEVIMYHADWGQYSYKQDMTTEAFADINSLAYAFIGFDSTGKVFALDAWGDQLELPLMALNKKRKPYLKTSLAFGGWTNAGQRMDTVFSAMAANEQSRNNFIQNAIAAVRQTGATDINIDWEYVKPGDVENFILLLQGLKAAMPELTLSIAAPAGPDNINVFSPAQWQTISNLVTRISIMTYDYFGAFSDVADFHSPWKLSTNSPHINTGFCIENTLAGYNKMGIPTSKLALGFPNYARSMIVANKGDFAGLYQPIIGTPQGDFPGCDGIYSWDNIQKCLNQQPSSLDQLGVKNWEFYDSNSDICKDANMCLLCGQLPNGTWVVINFIDQNCAATRAAKAKELGMGGVMLWANYTESTNPQNSIINAVSNSLNNKAQQKAKTAVIKQASYLKDVLLASNYASNKKIVLQKLHLLNDKLSIETTIKKYRAILIQHRNIFKLFIIYCVAKFSIRLSQALFDPPKSFQLAKKMWLAFSQNSHACKPTKTIKNHFSKKNRAAFFPSLQQGQTSSCLEHKLLKPSAPPLT